MSEVIKLYDGAGDWVMDCKDEYVAARAITNGFQGCWSDNDGFDIEEFNKLLKKARRDFYLTTHYYDVILGSVSINEKALSNTVSIQYDQKSIDHIDVCFATDIMGYVSENYDILKQLENTRIFQVIVKSFPFGCVELVTTTDRESFNNYHFLHDKLNSS